MTDAGQLL